MIEENLVKIRSEIEDICNSLQRDPKEVVLVGVTKFADIEDVKSSIEAGLSDVGENKVQEANRKFLILDDMAKGVTKHMIGHLQTNKVKQAISIFDLIQSVDSMKLAKEIDSKAKSASKVVDVLIQVNVAGEEQKYGFKESEVIEVVEEISGFENINILGLMTIAPYAAEEDIVRGCFKGLRILRDELENKYNGNDKVKMKYLSMGMTDDFKIALEEGSNMVRVGRAIFQ